MTDDHSELRLLTVKQPHAWDIVHGSKDVENRTWRFWMPLGTIIGIHAALRFDMDALAEHPPVPNRVGDKLHYSAWPTREQLPRGCVVGFATVVDDVTDSTSRWAEPGHHHWVLADRWALPE